MQDHWFDALSRLLATGASRRVVLRGIAAGAIGGSASLFGGGFLRRDSQFVLAHQEDPSAPPPEGEPPPAEEPPPDPPPQSCASQEYAHGTRFGGEAVQADYLFFPALNTIDGCASTNNVRVHVTSSYRDPGEPVEGAIVPPAASSNHHAGHAIDFNLWYPDANGELNQFCNSDCLGGTPLPQSVAGFLQCVRDAGLRWGGDFTTPDSVHIDDGLIRPDMTEEERGPWADRVNAMVNSAPCAECQTCDQGTATCRDLEVCNDICCQDGEVCLGLSGCCAAAQVCLGVCCLDGDVCAPPGTCVPADQMCGDVLCLDGEVCTAFNGCCPAGQVCADSCCSSEELCLDGACQPPPPLPGDDPVDDCEATTWFCP
jgi:hypothetical protein